MRFQGTFIRRHFEPLVLSVQVLIDLAVVLLACRLGYETRESFAWRARTELAVYREIFLLTGAVTLVCFRVFGMYSPWKSRLDTGEFKSIAKGTLLSFLVVHMLLVMLRGTVNLPDQGDLQAGEVFQFSRLTLVVAFVFIFALTALSRCASLRAIRYLHRHGVGSRPPGAPSEETTRAGS